MSRTYSQHWPDYELIDAGNDRKLERWGNIITIRPERNAYFKSILSENDWRQRAHFEFIEKTNNSGDWKALKSGFPNEWQIVFNQIVINLKLTKFKHIGIFPEQRTNWDFIGKNLFAGDRFLNLFGYTGIASVVARRKGADVFHCDSVKQVLAWGRENMDSSGLSDIHWVLEDALKFARREVKRGNKYKGIIMDPPAFGIGAKKERWKIENKFSELMELSAELVEEDGFVIANTYSPRLKSDDIYRMARIHFGGKEIKVSTLSIKSTTGKIIEYGELTRIA